MSPPNQTCQPTPGSRLGSSRTSSARPGCTLRWPQKGGLLDRARRVRYKQDMKSIAEVRPRDGYHLWIRFEDGVEGEVDLSHLAGQGVFSVWRDRQRFEDVRIGEFGELSWGGEVDLCPDSLYLRLTGRTAEEVLLDHETTPHA